MTVEQALEAQKKSPRKIIVDVYTSWCGPCKMMDSNTFTNADVINYINKNYYAIKFNAESPEAVSFKGQNYGNPNYDPNKTGRNGVHEFSRALGVNAYPTIVYLDEELNLLAPVSGYRTPQQLELYLKFFAEDHHKSVTTTEQWTAYQNNFKPAFK
jgi:thioredoxin-related protein